MLRFEIVGACVLLLAVGAGCGKDHRPITTDGGSDAAAEDGGPVDAGAVDAGGTDAGATDAGPAPCTGDDDCVPGWTCSEGSCGCDAPEAESCNELDDDCDGTVDEGSGADIGCAFAELCIDGTCGCPDERMCGARCVDIARDPEHCGDCATACALGDVCADGSCCAPSGAETCNGADDDCDGTIDEGSATAIGCAEGESCVAGSCECPTMCGGACRDLDTDEDHCGSCGSACALGQVCRSGACCTPTATKLDLLLMVDNSNSMSEEQESLAAQLPRLVTVLTTGDLDSDGTADFTPVEDLHLGVVTADMGVGGFTVPTCSPGDFGEDGILRTEGNTSISGCSSTYPKFLQYTTGDDASAFAMDGACVATVGTGGCGFEQQLEAVLKATTPSTSSIRFHDGTTGHADGANSGFLRSDAVLGAILLTDENDCSAADPELFNPSSSVYTADLNLRCFSYPGALQPVSRYVDGLQAAVDHPDQLIFAAITGVPVDLVSDPSTLDYDAILTDSRMEERIDPSNPTRLVPSCDVAGRGLAFPPRRIVQAARDLEVAGSSTVVQSICQEDFAPALDAIIARLVPELGTTCE